MEDIKSLSVAIISYISGKMRNKTILKLTILIIACLVSKLLLSNVNFPIALIGVVVYIWLLLKHPDIALLLSILAAFDFFSMVDDNFLRLPRVFRLKDLMLISMFIPLLRGVYKGDKRVMQIFDSPICKAIAAILIMVVFQVIITRLRYGESINSIVRAGSRYAYYSLFFTALYILMDHGRFRRFVGLFIGSVLFFCLLYILQFFVGADYKIFPWAIVEYQDLEGFIITRSYVKGSIASTLIFHIWLFLFLFSPFFKKSMMNIFTLVSTGAQTLLTLFRSHIIGVIMGTLIGILCARERAKVFRSLKIVFVITAILFFVDAGSTMMFHKESVFSRAITKRMLGSYDVVSRQKDTFGFRISDSLGLLKRVGQNPLFGIGLVHNESSLFAAERGFYETIRNSDSGMICLLVDFGIPGLIWLIFFAVIVFRRGLVIYKSLGNHIYRIHILGIFSFFFGRIVGSFALSDFVMNDGITVIAISLVFLEAIDYHYGGRRAAIYE